MPATAPMPPRPKDQLWTADEFLDWLEPGIKAELIRGEKHTHSPVNLKHARLPGFIDRLLGPYVSAHLRHRFYRRQGELLVEFAQDAEQISSHSVEGFWVRRAWLDPDRLPDVLECHTQIAGAGTK